MKEGLFVRDVSKVYFVEKGIFLKKVQPKHVLKNVSLKLCPGEIVALVGESGSGKSTLAKIIAKLEKPDSGEVIIDGINAQNFPSRVYGTKVGIVFQNPLTSLNPKLKVKTILNEVIHLRKKVTGRSLFDLKTIAEIFSLDEKVLNAFPSQISGGQAQRVAIARSYAMFPNYLILDEVTSSLDVSTSAKIVKIFQNLNREFKTAMLFITHDLILAGLIANKIFVLKDGEIVEEGDTFKVLNFPENEYTQYLKESII